jgi:hypothetical protein
MALATLARKVAALEQAAATPTAAKTLAAIRRDRAAVLTRAGYEFNSYQADFLRSTARRELLLCCRQAGKSTACAARAVAEVLLVPRALVLLVSPSLRQSAEVFAKALTVLDRLGPTVPVARRTATELRLANDARLVSLPGSAQTIRGFSEPRLVVLDEAAFIRDELLGAVSPMVSRSRGVLAMASSAFGRRGVFYESWANGGDDWRRTKVTADMVPALTPADLEAQRRTLGPLFYRQEMECEFLATLDQLFSPEVIDAALVTGRPPLFPPEAV